MTSFRILATTLPATLLLTACATTPLDVSALHDRTLTLDTHIDIPLTYMGEINPGGPTELQVDLPKLRQGQLDSGFWIVYTPQGELTYSGIKAAQEISETRPHPVRDNDRPRWNGLSPAGYRLITALNDAGVMVDVSHAAKSTMMQAADASATPIIASHSGVKAVADSARNLDDEQLRKIAEVNGVAQMVALGAYVKAPTAEQKAAREALDAEFGSNQALWGTYKKERYDARRKTISAMAPEATVADFVDHIDHAVAVAGVDHVGIASDFDGGGGIVGWKDASETQNVTAELVKRGYSEADIAKIWGGNLLRVMEAVEAVAG